MSGDFRTANDFVWPGTEILRNKLGLCDVVELERVERALTYGRLVELRATRPVTGRFDLAHLQAIHGYVSRMSTNGPVGCGRFRWRKAKQCSASPSTSSPMPRRCSTG